MTSPSDPRIPPASADTPVPQTAIPGGLREVTLLAYPVILTQISITTMQLVDSAMVGVLGATALAAVGLGGVWLWTMTCGLIGITTAVQTFVSQYHGRGHDPECGTWTWQGLYAVVPATLLFSFALYFGADAFMRWLGPSPELQPLAAEYMSMRALGAAGIGAAVALSSFFRGLGDTRTPLYATLIANATNAILDYGLIYGEFGLPEWGVGGAGAATAISEWVYLIALIPPFCTKSIRERYATHFVLPSKSAIRRLLVTGIPIGGQWALEMTSFAAFLTLVARLGDAAMAASQAFIVLLSISFMQAIGLSTAVSTLVGNYIGSGDLDAAERSLRSGMRLAALLAAGIAVIFLCFPGELMSLFSSDPNVLSLGISLMGVGALYQVFDAFAIVADGALRGAGDTRWPFVVRFLLSWFLFLPLGYALGILAGGGLAWAWFGGVVYVALLAGLLVYRFRSGAWRAIEI